MKKYLLIFILTIGTALFLQSCGDDNNTNTNPINPEQNKPIITSIDPTIVFPNDVMSIKGSNFKEERASSKVYFNDLPVENYISWSDKEIKVAVPAITSSGKVKVVVNDTASNEVDYTYDTNPRILSAGMGIASVGDPVSIKGVNFGDSEGTVEFNSTPATKINSWTNTDINVVVPTGATSGDLIVKTADGKISKPFYFTIMTAKDPYIRRITPGQFHVGDTITIEGENFGDTRGSSVVLFNSLPAANSDYVSWSDALIKVKCPVGAVSGLLRVKVGTQASNTSPYTIIAPLPDPIIYSLNKFSSIL